jgi:nucleoside transporter
MKPTDIVKLSLMMLMEYFIWGAWYVTMSTSMSIHLKASGGEIGSAYNALAIATMISPFFVGMIADRFFPAQRVMGWLHIVGAMLLYLATQVADTATFYWIILIYSLLYMPTIALSNSVAFRQMSDPGKQFPWIRVFGTVGWMLAGVMISTLKIEQSEFTFHMAAISSFMLGIFSFFLPHTPSKGKSSESTAAGALGTDALVLFTNKAYLIFFVAAVLVCIPLSFYYGLANLFLNQTGMENAAAKMTMGQVSEALFILAIPFLFNRIGVKNMVIVGMIAWLLRYVCFAYGNNNENLWMLYAGIILHGICYDFFFVTGYMYTEKKASAKIKSAAQGLFTFATYGLGMFIGTWVFGAVADYYTVDSVYHWRNIWYVPAAIASFALIYFLLFFKEKKEITHVP